MVAGDNNWNDWQKYMAAKLDHIDDRVSVVNEKLSLVREEISVLRTKNAIWSTIIGGLSSAIVAIFVAYISKAH